MNVLDAKKKKFEFRNKKSMNSGTTKKPVVNEKKTENENPNLSKECISIDTRIIISFMFHIFFPPLSPG